MEIVISKTKFPLLIFLMLLVSFVLSMNLLIGICAIVAITFTYVAFRIGIKKLLLLGIVFVIIIPPINFLPPSLSIGVINPLTCLIILCFVVSILYKLKRKDLPLKASYFWLFIIFVSTMLASVFNAYYQDVAIYQSLRFIMGSLLVYMLVSYLVKDKMEIGFLINAVISIVSIHSVYAIVEYVSEYNFIFYDILHQKLSNLEQFRRVYRAYGTTGLPNVLSCLIVTVVPLIIYKFKESKKWINLALLAVNLAALYCTMSRAGVAVLVVTGLLYFLVKKNRTKTLYLGVVLIGFGVLMGWNYIGAQNVELEKLELRWDINNIKESGSYWHRMYKLESAQLILQDRPFLGIGFGNYPYVSDHSEYLNISDPNALNTFDNMYLKIVSETGIVGFSVFVVLIGVMLTSIIRGIRFTSGESRILLGCIAFSIISFLIYSVILETFFWNSLNILFWLLVAVGLKIVSLSRADYFRNSEVGTN
ncbi:O-antigen ligase family protein [Paenibacillus jiagnxiensis]|uniref:O-antigen ligase family protein n=1 Tax=Paenibacillus jiagnxiensis TaxID=3228926 RepID=UPI0033B2D04A